MPWYPLKYHSNRGFFRLSVGELSELLAGGYCRAWLSLVCFVRRSYAVGQIIDGA